MEHYWNIFFCLGLTAISGHASERVPKKDDVVTLVFVGDINFDGPQRGYVEQGQSFYNASFEHVAKYIREADYAVGNLESPLGTNEMRKHPGQVPGKYIFFLAPPECSEALKYAGIDAVTLANNHMNDFGDNSVKLTVKALRESGVQSFGFNTGDPHTSQEPLVQIVKGMKFGFLGYTNISLRRQHYPDDLTVRKNFKTGMTIYSDDMVRRDVDRLKKMLVDVIVVFMHWGKESTFSPNEFQKSKKDFLVSLGVHIIVGSHPHVIQGLGYYRKSFVSFSMGNFISGFTRKSQSAFQSLRSRSVKRGITKDIVKHHQSEAVRSMKSSKDTFILKIQITKSGLITASYLPCEILFNEDKESFQAVPIFGPETEWLDACGKYDTLCLNNDKVN